MALEKVRSTRVFEALHVETDEDRATLASWIDTRRPKEEVINQFIEEHYWFLRTPEGQVEVIPAADYVSDWEEVEEPEEDLGFDPASIIAEFEDTNTTSIDLSDIRPADFQNKNSES
jgi:hypothetical protein